MDSALSGTLAVGAGFLPWMVEVAFQLRLQARFIAALPESVRAALPPHPRRPWLAFLGSLRFNLALWRYVRRDLPDDSPTITRLKRQICRSLRREMSWITGGVVVLAVLIATGGRPF
jgi:hypothetical protein